ncbi:MAG: hypothetical protein M3P30_02305 [Chloroflexota bacterium]|nr:hypothetical protein [Chloroflexota bacterium]
MTFEYGAHCLRIHRPYEHFDIAVRACDLAQVEVQGPSAEQPPRDARAVERVADLADELELNGRAVVQSLLRW